jgi:hypothetical protein
MIQRCPCRVNTAEYVWLRLMPQHTFPLVLNIAGFCKYLPQFRPISVTTYRVNLCTWCLQYRKLQVMFVVPASHQTLDTRLTLTSYVIPNSKYVIMVSDWNCLKYFCVFLYCNHQVHRDFLITLYYTLVGMIPSLWIYRGTDAAVLVL